MRKSRCQARPESRRRVDRTNNTRKGERWAIALGTFIAGRYSGTYDAADVGICKDGYELEQDTDFDDIAETDAWGGTVIDGIFRGGNCFLQFTSEEYKAGSLGAFWPYGSLGTIVTAALPIGALASTIAKAMVLTVTPNTPAAGSVNTLTGSLSLLAKNNNGKLIFNSKLREVPVRLRLYPSVASGTATFFATT